MPVPASATRWSRLSSASATSAASASCSGRGSKPASAPDNRPAGPKKASMGDDEPSSGSGHHRTCVRTYMRRTLCRKKKGRSLRMFSPTAFLTADEAGQYAARARSGKPSGSPDLAFKDTYTAAYPDERGGALMGWLDKLLGRDKEDAGEPAGTSTSVESDMDGRRGRRSRPARRARSPAWRAPARRAAVGRGGLRAASSLPPAVCRPTRSLASVGP